MKKYFGTDGIRGIPNENLTKEIVSNVACSVEEILKPTSVAVILDTRNSSVEILDWICEGFSENIEVINYGVLPSGSMPVLLNHFGHNLGIVISASHNPSEYNGIKLIDENGSKLQDEIELAIESNIENISSMCFLSLGKLFSSSSFFKTVFLSFYFTGISCKKACLF